MPGETFDAASEPNPAAGGKKRAKIARQFLGVQFDCCRTYSRIYINRDRTAFAGNCPRCGKQVRIEISPDGQDTKFFTAS